MAAIDMLGTIGARTEREELDLHAKWEGLVGLARRVFRPEDGFGVRPESDTIKVVGGGGRGTEALLESFGRAAWEVVVRSMQDGAPVRGCVAAGEYCAGREDLVTGAAVAEAKEWHECGEWIGVVAAPSAGIELDRMAQEEGAGRGFVRKCYVRYDVPQAGGSVRAWAVNWPGQCESSGAGGGAAGMMRIIEEGLGRAPDKRAALKWNNAKRFCDYVVHGRDGDGG